MTELLLIVQGIIERGFIFGIVVAGVYVASQLIRFDNLAVEGAFGLGGAITALLISWGVNPWLALVAALGVGLISGLITGLLNTQLQLNNLISGIVVTTGAFSIMLKVAGSNLPINNQETIFSLMPDFLKPYHTLILLGFLCTLLVLVVAWFLKTEIGLLLHAVGDSPQMLVNIGKSVASYTLCGLALSNMLAALSGALFVQYVGYFSIWGSVGVLIIGLAALLIAQTMSLGFGSALFLGAIAYQTILSFTLELQVDQDWNKLITALLIVVLMLSKRLTQKEM